MALNIAIGDNLVFDNAFEYQGPEYTFARIRCSIGYYSALNVFEELLYADSGINLPLIPTWAPFSQRILVKIVERGALPGVGVVVGDTYDLEVKIYEGTWPAQIIYAMWSERDAITITGAIMFQNLSVVYTKT